MPEVLLRTPLRQKNTRNTDHFMFMQLYKNVIHIMVMIQGRRKTLYISQFHSITIYNYSTYKINNGRKGMKGRRLG
jgi:hypothetical protein